MRNDPKLIKDFLQNRQQQYLYRKARISQSPQSPKMQIDGKEFLTFCSNDYLGLANHPEIVSAFRDAANIYGVGSGAAHLINGHSIEHQCLEEELAEFTGRERALLFSTGYMANMGVVNALMDRGDTIFADKLNHASLVDAGLVSRAKMKRYGHSDITALNRLYQRNSAENTIIISDGVFSMDGDTAPVKKLAEVASNERAWLMIDDAHGFGTLGKTGAGLLEQENLSQHDVPILMATLGKGVGTAGAFVAGSEDIIEFLIQTARTYIYTTAMPAAIAAATRVSLKLVQQESWRRDRLTSLIDTFKQYSGQIGLRLLPSSTAIQPILVGSTEKAVQISQKLEEKGILVSAIRPPTVPEGTARLRVTFSANHTEEDIEALTMALEEIISE